MSTFYAKSLPLIDASWKVAKIIKTISLNAFATGITDV